jgi:hypothetical protein
LAIGGSSELDSPIWSLASNAILIAPLAPLALPPN